ncbi:alpha/beta hydrolase [Kitasatospora sp. NPDC002227]|uniref:alpha/beta hydrolase n=1 Tax=Kitasatospora sp. NPDC002227 TaxID=3154773 RepID=UPI00332689C5
MASRPRPTARSGRLRRTLCAALVTASVALPIAGAARPGAVPAPAPTAPAGVGPLDAPALAGRYATTRADILSAEQAATGHGDHARAAALRTMADPARHFLLFDGRDGGRSVEVFGDLAAARQLAVLVPGADNSLDHYDRLRSGATALNDRLRGTHSAVLAWLGYRTPGTLDPAQTTAALAERAAPPLDAFLAGLHTAAPADRIALLCHSYGSVVCGRAASGLTGVSDLVLYGSPGVGVPNARALHTGATVWAGRGAGDWIAAVPHLRLPLLFTSVGFGTDPVSAEFGARIFPAGPGGHSDYLRPGSPALPALARIVTGAADTTP